MFDKTEVGKVIQRLLLGGFLIIQACNQAGNYTAGKSSLKKTTVSENTGISSSGNSAEQKTMMPESKMTVSEENANTEPKSSELPSSPINLTIRFQQFRGDASYKNCLAIAVNGGSRFELGCNHDGDLTKEVSVPALSKPSVNSIRLFFSTNGNQRGSTEDKSANTLMRVKKLNPKTFEIGYEDSGDDDFNDYIFSVSTSDNVSLQIENCPASECRIE